MAAGSEGSPERFGPFLLLRELGVGGMGAAHLAVHPESDALLVVKRMHPELLGDRSLFKRFVHEAKVASHVRHPNVAALVAMGAVDREPFLATEYVFGMPLSQIIDDLEHARIDPMPLDLALFAGVGLAAGVAGVHEARHRETGAPLGLLHRDIGSRNVLLGFDGRVRLIDLGLGKSVLSDWQTAHEALAGSPDYMPPEQAMGQTVDQRADVYSTSVTLWELLAGRKRIRVDNVAARLTRAIAAQPERLCDRRADATPSLEQLLGQAMAPDPARRLPSAKELERGLLRELEATGRRPSEEDVVRWLMAVFPDRIESDRKMLASLRAGVIERGGAREERTKVFVAHSEGPLSLFRETHSLDSLPTVKAAAMEGSEPTAESRHFAGALRSAAAELRPIVDYVGRAARELLAAAMGEVSSWSARIRGLSLRARYTAAAISMLLPSTVVFAVVVARSAPPREVAESEAPGPGRAVLGEGEADTSVGAGQDAAGAERSSVAKAPRPEPWRATEAPPAAIDEGKRAALVERLRILRRTRFDVGWQRRLTELGAELSSASSKRALDRVERAIERLERER